MSVEQIFLAQADFLLLLFWSSSWQLTAIQYLNIRKDQYSAHSRNDLHKQKPNVSCAASLEPWKQKCLSVCGYQQPVAYEVDYANNHLISLGENAFDQIFVLGPVLFPEEKVT